MKELKYKERPIKGICNVKFCKRKTHGRSLCSTHRSQKVRMIDPVRYAFNNIRNRARQRNILFTITLEQFRFWCHKVKVIGFGPGRSSESYSIDRIHNDLGYHADNIQVLKKKDNVKKYFSYDWRTKQAYMMSATPISEGEEMPF